MDVLSFMKNNHSDIGERIEKTGELPESDIEAIKSAADEYLKLKK